MAFNATPEQSRAIAAKGNVTVSAAAGSGKTAVLTERVVRLLTDKVNPVSADRLLIVTFTNAAAAEMRTRIENRLSDECRANPDDIGLLKQSRLLGSAKICTIDSFCIDFVRENFEKAGVSPDFKMSDQNSLDSVNEYVLGNILNEYFEEKNPVFLSLLDLVGAEYDDGNFSDFVLDMYLYSRQMAEPDAWFTSLSEMYSPGTFGKTNAWYEYAVKTARKKTEKMRETTAKALDILITSPDDYKKYGEPFEIISDIVNELYEKTLDGDWDCIFTALSVFDLPKLPQARTENGKIAKAARDYILELAEGLKKLFYTDEKSIKEQLEKIYEPALLLTEILKELDSRIFEEYLRLNTFTFHNTEHLAYKLLCEAEKDGDTAITDRYLEVMVDEYQDTNDLQNRLFEILSNGGKRLFAVGDVKQSIYGFRGAEPANFLRRIQSAVPESKAKEYEPKKIILGNNFRSKPEICEYINGFFTSLMTEKTGEIVYNEDERLIPAAVYPKTEDVPVSFDITEIDCNKDERLKIEARQIAAYIKRVMNSGECIRKDENTLRGAEYSDFAILLRSTKSKAAVIAEELKKSGIPVNYSIEQYAETTEISAFLSLLKVIDNPQSDIELLSVLMSPIFGLTADEAANLRIKKRGGSLYSALVFSAENGDGHCKAVLEALQKYRILSVTLSLPKLISRLLYETDYLNTVSALEDGDRRRGNLLMLITLAEQYAADIAGGIGSFIKFVVRQSESGMRSAAAISAGKTVKIMSIHGSKGLQFPVCIVADTVSHFNDNDSKNRALYSSDYGIGFKYFDEEKKQGFTTLGREVIIDSTRRHTLEEELRLLYVAMTRAQDKLHFTAVVDSTEKETAKYAHQLILSGGKAENIFDNMKSYAKWLFVTSMLHPDGAVLRPDGINIIPEGEGHIDIRVISPEEDNLSVEKAENPAAELNQELADKIRQNTEYTYPYGELLEIEAKSSVSALANKAESDKYAFSARPAFMSDGGITAAERGTATHKIIEFIDFDKTDDLEGELERLYEWQYISERELNAVNREKLKAFFESGLFARIKSAELVKREMRFLTELPASKINPALDGKFDNENIIVQGAVDLCFIENGEVVVVDFKTDRTESAERLAESYGEQLSIYAVACEKIFEKRVKQKIIYSLSLSEEIEV